MILDYESQNHNVSLRVGLSLSKVSWGFESLDTKKKNLAVYFLRNIKYLIGYILFKKRKTHLEMTYFILMKGFLNVFLNLAL